MAGNVGASVVARWQGDGILTVLAPSRWCQKKREPTINMRWRGALQRVEAGWWLLWECSSMK